MWKDDARLIDIQLACQEALGYVRNVTYEAYLGDLKLQRALCMLLEIVGEAARAVSPDFKAAHPGIPWPQMVGLRNRIIHEYFRVDLNIIWEIVQKDVPVLLALVTPLAPPPPSADSGQ